MLLGEFLKRYRNAHSLSGRKFAEKIGVDKYRLQKWESGDGSPKADDFAKIKAYFPRVDFNALSEEVLNEVIEDPLNPDRKIVIEVQPPTGTGTVPQSYEREPDARQTMESGADYEMISSEAKLIAIGDAKTGKTVLQKYIELLEKTEAERAPIADTINAAVEAAFKRVSANYVSRREYVELRGASIEFQDFVLDHLEALGRGRKRDLARALSKKVEAGLQQTGKHS